MSGGPDGPRGKTGPDRSPARHLHRVRRAHELADREAGTTAALLRKARAVFLLRARLLTGEGDRQIAETGRMRCRRAAARELAAACLMHRLALARVADRPDGGQTRVPPGLAGPAVVQVDPA